MKENKCLVNGRISLSRRQLTGVAKKRELFAMAELYASTSASVLRNLVSIRSGRFASRKIRTASVSGRRMETEWKGHIRRSGAACNHVVYHEALLSSNVRPVTPPLAGVRRARASEPRRNETKRAEGPHRRRAPVADRRDRDEPSSREVFSGVLGRPTGSRSRARETARVPLVEYNPSRG